MNLGALSNMGSTPLKHLQASFELANCVGMEMRVRHPLCGGAFLQQDRANDLIASLNRITKAQLKLVKGRQLFHGRLLPVVGAEIVDESTDCSEASDGMPGP